MRSVPITLLAATLVFVVTREVYACGLDEFTGIEQSIPADGDTGVPTDVVPWLDVVGFVRLVNELGEEVPTSIETRDASSPVSLASIVELFPLEPLKPNARYTIEARDSAADETPGPVSTVTFTTGEGSLVLPVPETPIVDLIAFDALEFRNSCVYARYQGCLSTQHEGMLDVRITRVETTSWYVANPRALQHLILNEPPIDTCIEVRARDVAGRRSEPWVHCLQTEGLPQLVSSDEDVGIFVKCDASQVQALPRVGNAPKPDAETDSGDAGAPVAQAGNETDAGGAADASAAMNAGGTAKPPRAQAADASTPASEPRGRAVASKPAAAGCTLSRVSFRADLEKTSGFTVALFGLGVLGLRRRRLTGSN